MEYFKYCVCLAEEFETTRLEKKSRRAKNVYSDSVPKYLYLLYKSKLNTMKTNK